MFASNSLPPPPSFGHEHRPLRLTSDSGRSHPQGGCHFQHSSGQVQRCFCQTFQHNRCVPGNICDCGHAACYHSHANNDGRLASEQVVNALLEKVKKLEEVVVKERDTRNSIIARERQVWEQEVRILREALAPFCHSESDLKKEIADIEDKVDTSRDEQSRLKEKVVAIDHVIMTLERRLEEYEITRSKKRKASIELEETGVMSPESSYISASPSASGATSISIHRSPQPSSPIDAPLPASVALQSPRSSGILNMKSNAKNAHEYNTHEYQLPSPSDEPRSSGFLSIDLAERLRHRKTGPLSSKGMILPPMTAIDGPRLNGAYKNSPGLPSPSKVKIVSGALPVSCLLSSADPHAKHNNELRSPKRYKHQHQSGMMALDVLANLSAASPLARASAR